jgi:anionic cell wall polymer biosynthesis LytR-Cps2A-Psr (LCP) family protein
VDAIGGVTVDVPRTIVDPRYPTDDFGYKLVRFDAGMQLMDGQRALEYARTRHPDNDFGRIRRQQQVVAALRQQILHLRSLPAVPAILGGCRNMSSDLGLMEYLDLASTLRQFGDGDIAMRTIDERMATETVTQNGAEVLMPSWEPIRALFRDTFRSTNTSASNSMAAR